MLAMLWDTTLARGSHPAMPYPVAVIKWTASEKGDPWRQGSREMECDREQSSH